MYVKALTVLTGKERPWATVPHPSKYFFLLRYLIILAHFPGENKFPPGKSRTYFSLPTEAAAMSLEAKNPVFSITYRLAGPF
jgi:hypothetical protein